MATVAETRAILDETALPRDLVETLLDGASVLWLANAPAATIAGDLALLYPTLEAGEVRALVRPTAEDGRYRLSVAASDRVGLLARTSSVCAANGLSIVSAAISTWPEMDLALQRIDVICLEGEPDWECIGARLRAVLGRDEHFDVPFTPTAPVDVRAVASDPEHTLVSVRAPDRIGLLCAIATWFEANGCNIEVAQVRSEDGEANDVFLVTGEVDAHALTAALSP
jgi:UTP:GlnB (protein PII) uridylyltransferase